MGWPEENDTVRLVVRPWLPFHIPLIEPDMRICRVAQPLLAFAPTEPTVRRYRSGLFRKDRRQIDHLCQACLDNRFREWEGIQEAVVGCPGHTPLLAAFAERPAPEPDDIVLEHA